MNKKGFAISVILYSIIFLIISILYMLLGITKTRYTVNKGLKDSIVRDLNTQRIDTDFVSDESCEITGNTTDYTPNLVLSINVTNNYGLKYKYDSGDWKNENTINVDHAGVYLGYFQDTKGGVGTCSVDVASKTMYRYRDCASNDYMYSDYYYENGTQKRDIIGCYFAKGETWTNWVDVKPESKIIRQMESQTSYKIKGVEYRYRDCASDDYMYGTYYYDDAGNQKRDIIGCYFAKGETWSNWSTVKPASSVTREIETRVVQNY